MAIDARQLKPAMMILLCVSTSAFAETGDDSLPPPPDARTMNGEAVFQLALVLNHYDTGLVVPVTQREGACLFRARICSAPGCRPRMCQPER